ncbi:MAG: ATP-binding protein [bacterium]
MKREAHTEQLPAILGFVDSACAGANLPEDVSFAVRLATEEACMNVVNHAYETGAPGPIAIRIERRPSDIVVTIADQGPPFLPASVPEPNFDMSAEDRALGGLGWHLIRQMMDEVHHEYDPAVGNSLTLVKRIPAHRDTTGACA